MGLSRIMCAMPRAPFPAGSWAEGLASADRADNRRLSPAGGKSRPRGQESLPAEGIPYKMPGMHGKFGAANYWLMSDDKPLMRLISMLMGLNGLRCVCAANDATCAYNSLSGG